MKYIATFSPEAWVNDCAIEVDPEGPTSWDCTKMVDKHRAYFEEVMTRRGESFDDFSGVLDNDDVLKSDPDAPEWVRAWRGPFTIRAVSA